MEAREEKRRASTSFAASTGYTGSTAFTGQVLSVVDHDDDNGDLTDEEMIERLEREEEEKYFEDVLRANTGDCEEAEYEDMALQPRVVEMQGDEDEDEDRYFELVQQANTERPSAFPDIDDVRGIAITSEIASDHGNESGDGSVNRSGSGRGSLGRMAEGVQSRSNSTYAGYEYSSVAPTTAENTDNTTQTLTQDVGVTVIDFAESLTMTAMEKGTPPIPYSPALSKSRPSGSLSFSSPSSNPFGKENRSKGDDEENLLQATLLSDSLLEKISFKKLEEKERNESKQGEKLDFSVFSSAATSMKMANLQAEKNAKTEQPLWDVQSQRVQDMGRSDSNGNSNGNGDMNGCDDELGRAKALNNPLQTNTSDLPSDTPLTPLAPFRGVNGYPASVMHKGVRSCNLPDHHVTAGCTAIVALKHVRLTPGAHW